MAEVGFSIVAFIIAIGVLVSVHEFGHFWVARRLGFKVLRFSVGFGRPLARWQGRDPDRVEYWLSSIPLGGYVKLLDEREAPVPANERDRAFNRRPIHHRIAVLLAGPGFNFLFAIVAYWALFVVGVPGIKPIVGAVVENSAAERAGLRANDEIVAVGDQAAPTLEIAVLAILDELLADGRIPLTVVGESGNRRQVELDVRGRQSELTEPDALFTGLGIEPGPLLPAVMGELTPGEAAERAGFERGDRVLSVDGQPIRSWTHWVRFVRERPNETVLVTVERSAAQLDIELHIGTMADNGQTIGRIGAGADVNAEAARALADRARTEQRYSVLPAFFKGLQKTWSMSALTVKMLGSMVVGDVSVRNLSGPISIAAYAGDSAGAGLTAFLGFLAIVSISLGILNLLPVPLLDGGQIVYQLAEWVKGAPLSERAMVFGQQIGVVLLIVLMSFAFYNDLTRLFG